MTITHRIMLRIYVIWAWRQFKNPTVLESALTVVLLVGFFGTVSVPSVIANTFRSPNALRYLMLAVSHADHIALGLLLAVSLATLWLSRNLVPERAFRLRFA